MRWALAVLFAGLVAGSLATRNGAIVDVQNQSERQALRQLFAQRVDEYVALHREIEQLLPPDIVTSDLQALFAPRIAMAREMRHARSRAHQGDIFTPALQVYFRTLIAETLWREGITDLLAIVEDENVVHTPARVNGDHPAGRSIPAISPVHSCGAADFAVGSAI